MKVRNDTGADLPRGSVVEFTDLILDELDPTHIWLAGDTPDGTNGYGIIIQPLPDGEICSCQVSGVCAALVNVTDESHKFANVKSGETVLESAASGAVRILYKPAGTGELQCAILLGGGGGSAVYIGLTDEELTIDGTGTVSRYEGSTGTETDTGIDDEVKNRMATVPTNRWVHYTQIDGVYYVIAARCTAITTTTTSSSSTTTSSTTTSSTTTAAPTTTSSTTTTTTSSSTTTTTAAPTTWYCVVLDESGDCMSGNNGCVENSGGFVTCGGPYGTQQSCIDSNCGAGNTSSTTTTTAAPTTTTTTTTTTSSSTTTAAPTTSTTTTTTTSGPQYYCWDCFGIPNCGQDLMQACGGSGTGPTSGPYNTSNCDGMCI